MGKISYSDHIKKNDISVILAELVFRFLKETVETVPLSEVVETSSGGTPNRSISIYYGGEIPWVKSGELNDSYIDKTEEYLTEEGLKNSSAKVFKKGTLLVAMYGATAGKTAVLGIDAATNQAVCAVFPKSDKISNEFLFWFFRAHRYYFIDISRGGAQPNISQTVINNTEIPLIGVKEQGMISAFLREIEINKTTNFDLIPTEIQNKVKITFDYLTTLSEIENDFIPQSNYLSLLRNSILQEAIAGWLTAAWREQNPVRKGDPDTDAAALLEKIKQEKQKLIAEGKIKKEKPQAPISPEEIPFELPEGWVWCRLGEIIDLISGQHIETTHCNKNSKGFPYLTGPADFGLINPIISKWTEKPKVKAMKDDILITVKGSGVGKTNICNLTNVVISRQLMAVRAYHVSKELLYYYLTQKKSVLQSAKDGLIPGITRDHLLLLQFPLPSLLEQQAIVDRVDKLLAMVTDLEQQVKERKGIAEEMMQAVLREQFVI